MDNNSFEQATGIRSWSRGKRAVLFCSCVLLVVGGILAINNVSRTAGTVNTTLDGTNSKQADSAQSNANQIPLAINGQSLNTQSFFGKSVRELLRSPSISQIDYVSRIQLNCFAFVLGEPGIKLIDDLIDYQLSQMKIDRLPAGSFGFGTAQRTERIAAYQRSLKLCGELYEGRAISQEESDSARASDAGKEHLAIIRLLKDSPLRADPEVKLALSKVFSEPMLFQATRFFFSHLDYSNLEAAYGAQVSPVAWQEIVSTMLLCNLGENCGAGSALTEQLCWQNAICKPNARADDAILASLSQRGVDTAALNEFVGRTYSRIVNRDTSMFFEKNK